MIKTINEQTLAFSKSKVFKFLVVAVVLSIAGCDSNNKCDDDNNTTEDDCEQSYRSGHSNNQHYIQNITGVDKPKPKYGFLVSQTMGLL